MKLAMALVVAAGFGLATPSFAEDAVVGVGVSPVAAGVTVGSDTRERDRTVIRQEEPREKTTVIKKEREEPESKTTVIKERN